MHAARRRTILTITYALHFKRGVKHEPRLPRLDDLSFFIPELLASDRANFIKECLRNTSSKQQVRITGANTVYWQS